MLARLLKPWADAALRSRCEGLEKDLDRSKARITVLELERDGLAAVAARDRARVQMETAEFARRTANAAGGGA